MPEKTKCPITADQFGSALPLTVDIGGNKVVASPKNFSTGSFGWYATGKVVIEVDGVPCSCQVGLNLTVVGSKDLQEAAPVAPPAKPVTVKKIGGK
jgi:hypothetical protein